MTDTKHIIECPACGKEMTKLEMKEAGVHLDICLNGCGGIFFDNRELEKFDDNEENIDEILNAIEGKTFEPSEDREVRICPICNKPMAKMGAANGEVQIDICHNCGGKFLDNGEIFKIREAEKEGSTKAEAILNAMCEEGFREQTKFDRMRQARIGFFSDLAKRMF